MAEFVEVCKVAELPEGECRTVTVGDTEIALARTEEGFFAVHNICHHHGGPLGEGWVEDCMIACPWHGWQYDLKTGKQAWGEDVTLTCYEVRVEGDAVLVKA